MPDPDTPRASLTDADLPLLRALSRQAPTIDAATSEIANLRAQLTLPKGTVHVFSDIHGEDRKLRHVIANAAGTLRPLVARVFGDRLSESERIRLLGLIYYPAESLEHLKADMASPEARAALVERLLSQELEVIRALAVRYPLRRLRAAFPADWSELFLELVLAHGLGRGPEYTAAVRRSLAAQGKDLEVLRLLSRVIRNLTVSEIVVGGDMGDRGPRIDRVIGTLMRQPRATIVWGNHDASWMGACLGHESLIATVLRMSLKFHRLAQLEEGYGIPLDPLEELARLRYADDPCARFQVAHAAQDDPALVGRMHKAAAVLEWKLEGQLARRRPHFQVGHRLLLERVDLAAGTIDLFGHTHPLLDTRFPTLDPRDPYRLDDAEARCMARMREAFLASRTLWEQMLFLFRRGHMWVARDGVLIFHGCVPVDERGSFLSFPIEGRPRAGRALFDAARESVRKAFQEKDPEALDLLWYHWAGALSPCFGKDKMTTFERYLLADKETHHETKNPYFKLIHEKDFCRKILAEFGLDPATGLIVNGHVPVKVETGESPLKRSGQALTIDGAFAEAYGDRGYTLTLTAERTALAEHHRFDSVEDAIRCGKDIVPTITDIMRFDPPRPVDATEEGKAIRAEIAALEKLVTAYRENVLAEG